MDSHHLELLSAEEIIRRLDRGLFDSKLKAFYGYDADLQPYRQRISDAVRHFCDIYGDQPLCVFSVSGRTELGGNHTDHQHGCVLASGISLDILAVAAPSSDRLMRVHSEGYQSYAVSADELSARSVETGQSSALLRGIAAGFAGRGFCPGGFCAYLTSNVPQGSGLSSSAAYEVVLAAILNRFYAGDSVPPAEYALIAQNAENEYFGKPCGLMDQMACALGCAVFMDFADQQHPKYESILIDPDAEGYSVCIIDSGADHAGLTDEYAAIPNEMRAVADAIGCDYLREADKSAVLEQLPLLRSRCGDRAVLRAFHFFHEKTRVRLQADALKRGDFTSFLRYVNESGRSSAFFLQNLTPAGCKEHQEIAVTLAVCEELLHGEGAFRVHGGGFAGTVQAYVPHARLTDFIQGVSGMLGNDVCRVLQLRSVGASALW